MERSFDFSSPFSIRSNLENVFYLFLAPLNAMYSTLDFAFAMIGHVSLCK